MKTELILIRGGGDLASGVALRLHHASFQVVIAELAQPLAVRRAVAFSEAVYADVHRVEDVTARLVRPEGITACLQEGEIPVLVDPEAAVLKLEPGRWEAVVDGRMMKTAPAPLPVKVPLHIGLGPGFNAGQNCDAVVETRRSHTLGRVYREGRSQADSGLPEGDPRRVLRAPSAGVLWPRVHIGDHVKAGQAVAEIQNRGESTLVISPLEGILRGLIHEGVRVEKNMKIGDVDARDDSAACYLVSDKALAVGGGVLEAILGLRKDRHDNRGNA